MEFLVISHMREPFLASVPQSVMRQILEARREITRRQKEAGKIVKVNAIPGWGRNMTIYKCDSTEEFQKLINEVPAMGMCFSHEAYALSDDDEAIKAILENMEKGDEIMPGGSVK